MLPRAISPLLARGERSRERKRTRARGAQPTPGPQRGPLTQPSLCVRGEGARPAPGRDETSARERDFLVRVADPIVIRRGDARVDVGGDTRAAEAVALHRMHAGGAQEQMLFRVL